MPSYVLGAKQGYAVNKVGKTSVLQELTLFGGGAGARKDRRQTNKRRGEKSKKKHHTEMNAF